MTLFPTEVTDDKDSVIVMWRETQLIIDVVVDSLRASILLLMSGICKTIVVEG